MITDQPAVYATVHDDGSAAFTISVDGEAHKFSVSVPSESSNARIEYEETLTHRGTIEVSSPDHEVWKAVMQSEQMTSYLDSQDSLTGVVREQP